MRARRRLVRKENVKLSPGIRRTRGNLRGKNACTTATLLILAPLRRHYCHYIDAIDATLFRHISQTPLLILILRHYSIRDIDY
jgi:hypothetical protein